MANIYGNLKTKIGGESMSNNVEHPQHYQNKIEVIEFIEAWNLNFHLGNVVKYICRAGRKDPTTEIEDLKKAMFYLKRWIELNSGQDSN